MIIIDDKLGPAFRYSAEQAGPARASCKRPQQADDHVDINDHHEDDYDDRNDYEDDNDKENYDDDDYYDHDNDDDADDDDNIDLTTLGRLSQASLLSSGLRPI